MPPRPNHGATPIAAGYSRLQPLWLRHQPDSALSRWFRTRTANAGKRAKRIAIVALARKLQFERDMDIMQMVHPMVSEVGPGLKAKPLPKVTEAAEDAAVKYGFTDERGVYKALKKIELHLFDPDKKLDKY